MAITLEEIWKLPPKERFEALKAFQAEQKKLQEDRRRHHEEEAQKSKKEAEEILKKSIDEIAFAEEEGQLIEKLEKEQTEKKKENLEDIAGESKTKSKNETAKEDFAYQSRLVQEAQIKEMSRNAAQNLYSSAKDLREAAAEKGYLNPSEMNRVQNLTYALEEKSRTYKGNEDSKKFMSRAEQILEEMKNPLSKEYR